MSELWLRLSRCGAGHEVAPGGPSGADLRYVKREWARYEAMLGAVNDPTSLEAAVAKRAHKRLAEIAAEVKLTNSGVVELANQVCLQSPHPGCADRCDPKCVISEHARIGIHCNAVPGLQTESPLQWKALSIRVKGALAAHPTPVTCGGSACQYMSRFDATAVSKL